MHYVSAYLCFSGIKYPSLFFENHIIYALFIQFIYHLNRFYDHIFMNPSALRMEESRMTTTKTMERYFSTKA